MDWRKGCPCSLDGKKVFIWVIRPNDEEILEADWTLRGTEERDATEVAERSASIAESSLESSEKR